MHNKICPSGLPNPYYERSSERILPGYSTPAATLPIRPSSSITDTTGLNKTGSSFGGLHGREGVSSNKKPAGSETRAGLLYSPIPKHHQPPTFATIPQNATPSQNWKSNDIRGPLAPIEADPTGHCERLTCHQCRLKTTRPKMICDQSLDPNCVVRICRPCLMDRKAYDDMPELRAPIFEFVPGGKLLCMKCRNICPCISCRRARGENGVMGNGLNGFYDLTDEARVEKLLKKKNRNGKDTPRKASHRRPNLADKKTIFSNRDITSVAHKHGNGQYKRAASEHIICLEKSWSELTGKSEQTISGRRSDVSGGSRKVKANRSTRSDHPGWRASTRTDTNASRSQEKENMAAISSTSYFSSQPQLPASDGASPATTRRSSSSNGRQPRRRRAGRCVMLEADAASGGGGVGGGAVAGRARSLTEEDLEELKGCLDLGFGFSYHEIPGLRGTLPGLELCYSMTRRFLDEQRTLVGQLEPAAAAAPIPDWKISGPGDDPDEVKARLKYWAQTVACTVKLCT